MVTSSKKSNWHFPPDLVLYFLPGITGLVAVGMFFTVPVLFLAAIVCGAVGAVLLGRARFPLYRQRRFFTFGSAALDGAHRKLYRRAYRWIACSAGLLLLLNVIVRWKA